MYELTVQIGEHFASIKTLSETVKIFIESKFHLVNEPVEGHLDLSIFIEEGYGTQFVDYDVEITFCDNGTNYRRADYLIEASPTYKESKVYVYDNFALKHALMNLYSSYIVHHKWGLLVHSSCILENEKAFLFAGQSGAGKSTVAKLSSPRPILSDEATILKIDETGKVFVFDSPFRSELEDLYSTNSFPLVGIQLLHQSLQNKRTKIGKLDGILHLLDKVFYWSYSSEDTKNLFSMCKILAENVPVYNMYFQKNDSFWREIS